MPSSRTTRSGRSTTSSAPSTSSEIAAQATRARGVPAGAGESTSTAFGRAFRGPRRPVRRPLPRVRRRPARGGRAGRRRGDGRARVRRRDAGHARGRRRPPRGRPASSAGAAARTPTARCARCHGSGVLVHTDRVRVRLPAGVGDGDRVRAERPRRPGAGGVGDGAGSGRTRSSSARATTFTRWCRSRSPRRTWAPRSRSGRFTARCARRSRPGRSPDSASGCAARASATCGRGPTATTSTRCRSRCRAWSSAAGREVVRRLGELLRGRPPGGLPRAARVGVRRGAGAGAWSGSLLVRPRRSRTRRGAGAPPL